MTLAWPRGDAVVTLLPERGRVLQVECAGEQAFWTDPNAPGWNVGGDRVWVGPESEWFWIRPGTTDFAFHEVPRALDPGAWEVSVADEHACECRLSATLVSRRRGGVEAGITITRSFTPVPVEVPLRAAVAYRTVTSVTIEHGPPDLWLDGWSLAQVRPGGVISISLTRPLGDDELRQYYEPVPWSDAAVGDGVVELNVRALERWKIGVPIDAVTGRMVYARPIHRGLLVIMRAFAPQPWSHYCDRPAEMDGLGDGVQAFNGTPEVGEFGEIEYHLPAVRNAPGWRHSLDTAVTIVGIAKESAWPAIRAAWLG